MRILAAPLVVLLVQTLQPQRPPTPPFDPQNARLAMLADAQLALELADDASIVPVPLADDGSPRYGFILDRLMTSRAAAVTAARRGKPLTVDSLTGPNSVVRSSVYVVAYPLDCDGRPVRPKSIAVVIERGAQPSLNMASGAPTFQPAEIAARAGLPLVPEGSLGQGSNSVAVPAAAVTVTYDGPACPSNESTRTFRFRQTTGDAKEVVTPTAKLPAGVTTPWPTVVRLGGWIDTQGRLRMPRAYGGPTELRKAAEDAAAAVRRPSLNINGVPVFQGANVAIAFVGEGEPTAPIPANPGPLLDPGASISIGGVIPVRSTYDWYGVSLENSQCPSSTGKSYGTMPDTPIKVGGGARGGPNREIAYMDVLRGGMGQGTRYRRLGSGRNAENTIVDIFELTFDGLPKPVRLYIDEYHWEQPVAPFGLVCLVPIPLSKDGAS